MDFSKQKAEDWLDDLETVGTYAAEKIGDTIKDMPITKAATGFASNPTAQEFGAQVGNLASATSKSLQEAYGGDPVDMALNYGPNAMGTIVGKSAAGWAKLPNKFSNMLDKMERAEISDVGASVDRAFINEKVKKVFTGQSKSESAPLVHILDHPKLYEQYPDLKTAKVHIEEMDGGNFGAYLKMDGKDAIKINSKVFDYNAPSKFKDSLLHEIQHAIQEKEGFARGGSPEMFRDITPLKVRQAENKLNEYIYKNEDKSLAQLENETEYKLLVNDVKMAQLEHNAPTILYNKLGGEIESRSVAARSNIPQDQLKYSQPYGSENIPLKEWIKAEDFLDGPSMSVGDNSKIIRFEAGKKLSKADKEGILKSLGDSYSDLGAPIVDKGTHMGYEFNPEYMHKSDITGKNIRHYITLPDGKKAHPSELFPEMTQSKIDVYLQNMKYELSKEMSTKNANKLREISESLKGSGRYKLIDKYVIDPLVKKGEKTPEQIAVIRSRWESAANYPAPDFGRFWLMEKGVDPNKIDRAINAGEFDINGIIPKAEDFLDQ